MKGAARALILALAAAGSLPAQSPAPEAVETPAALVQKQLDAYNARDLDAFLAPYAADAKVYRHPSTLLLDGREAMRKSYAETFRQHPRLHCELRSRLVEGPYVVDQESVEGLSPSPTSVLVIYEIRRGAIQNVWVLIPD